MAQSVEARSVLSAAADLGEGAIWHPEEQVLYWIDINGGTLHRYDPANDDTKNWVLGARVGTTVPVEGGDMLVALQTGIHRLNLATGALSLIVNPITNPHVRFNDGKCDPSGRFWVGTFNMAGVRRQERLYRLDGDGSLHTMLDGVSISNGIVWTGDRTTMYFIDTPTNCVQAFDYDDATGDISNGRTAVRIPLGEGDPDGMCIDSEDNLWIAMWGGSAVNRYHPRTGDLLERVLVAAPHTTSCALGGPDMKTLYITSARTELEANALAASPLSGNLFACASPVRGVSASFYKPH